MADRFSITLQYAAESKPDAPFETRSFLGLADRVAFEKAFSVTSPALGAMFDDEGNPSDDVHEEWVAWFVWRAAARAGAIDAGLSFEEFTESLNDLTISKVEELDPTKEAIRSA